MPMRVLRQCRRLALYLFEEEQEVSRCVSHDASTFALRAPNAFTILNPQWVDENVHEPDGVARSQPDPLRDWAVLLLRLRELNLRAERFVALTRSSASIFIKRFVHGMDSQAS